MSPGDGLTFQRTETVVGLRSAADRAVDRRRREGGRMSNLALLDLVLPYIFRGENIGPTHAALSALRVVQFETAVDDLGVTLRGHCEVNGSLDFFPGSG